MKKIIIVTLIISCILINVNAHWQITNGPCGSETKIIEAIGSDIFAGSPGGVVYISTDEGNNWTSTNFPLGAGLAVSGSSIYTAFDNKVFVSNDKGKSYSILNTGLPEGSNSYGVMAVGKSIFLFTENEGTVLLANDSASWTKIQLSITASIIQINNYLFAATNNGVSLSTDNGFNWKNSGLEGKSVTRIINFGTSIYAGTSGEGVYCSSDSGMTWALTGLNGLNITSLETNGTNIIAVANQKEIFLSDDFGTNWTEIKIELPLGADISYVKSLNNTMFLGTSNSGVFVSKNNGTSWNYLNKEIGYRNSVSALLTNNETLLAGNAYGQLFSSNNNGDDWNISGLAYGIYSLVNHGKDIYAATTNGVFISSNNGTNWLQIGLPNIWIKSLLVTDTEIFAGTEKGIYSTKDNGLNWTEKNNGLANNANIYSLAAKGSLLIASTFDDGIYMSNNNGESWIAISNGLPYDFVYKLYVYNNNIYASVWWNGVYVSTDNGASWKQSGLNEECITAFASVGNKLFAGTHSGLFISNDYGLSWEEVNSGLTNLNIEALSMDESFLYAGLNENGGVWKFSISEVVDIENNINNKGFYVFPNPAKKEIIIDKYGTTSNDAISVFNLDGKFIMKYKLINDITKIDISKFASGIYFIKSSDSCDKEVFKFIKE